MKFMFIGRDDQLLTRIKTIFHQERFDYIHYRDPGKALNNIREIDPDALIFMDDHYPEKGITVRKILANSPIPATTTCLFLSKDYHDRKEGDFYFINSALNSNINIDYFNNAVRKTDNSGSRLQFIITHPVSPGFITGRIDKVEGDTLWMVPDFPDSSASIVEQTEIRCCTLKSGDSLYTFSALLTYNGAHMKFKLDRKILKKIGKKLRLD